MTTPWTPCWNQPMFVNHQNNIDDIRTAITPQYHPDPDLRYIYQTYYYRNKMNEETILLVVSTSILVLSESLSLVPERYVQANGILDMLLVTCKHVKRAMEVK